MASLSDRLVIKYGTESAGDGYQWIWPEDIEIPEDKFRGRKFKPSAAKVKDLAESIIRNGQEQAIQCRINDENHPVVVFGRTRLEAISLINSTLDPKNKIAVKVELVEKDEKQAFLSAIAENNDRNAITAVDMAFNHQTLREEPFSLSDADIARDCGCSPGWVSKLKKLLTLDKAALKAIHEGAMTVTDGVNLADVNAVDQAKIADKATTKAATKAAAKASGEKPAAESGKGKSVASDIREAKKSSTKKPDGSSKKTPPTKATSSGESSTSISLTAKDIKEFFSTMSQEYYEDEIISTFCKKLLKFCKGEISNKQMENAVKTIAESQYDSDDSGDDAGSDDPMDEM